MPNTYSQIYIQAVFAVQARASLIQPEWRDELFKYITGILKNKNQKLIAIGERKILLAGRIWSVFLFLFPSRFRSKVRSESRGTSCKTDVQR